MAEYLTTQLRATMRLLEFGPDIVSSSAMAIPSDLRGQNRIIAIARAAGAATYITPPGGRALYDSKTFREAGLGLGFLSPWRGDHTSVLPALMDGDAARLRAEVLAQSEPEPA